MAPDRRSASCQIEINVIFGELSSQLHDGSRPQSGFEETTFFHIFLQPDPGIVCIYEDSFVSKGLGFCVQTHVHDYAFSRKMFRDLLGICAVISHTVVSDCVTLWTVACHAPLSMGILQARRILE